MVKTKRPSHVQVGPWAVEIIVDAALWQEHFDAQLLESDSNRPVFAWTDLRGGRIFLNPNNTEDSQREALLHELTHCCQFAAGLPNEGQVRGEDFVTRVTPWLLDTLTRNPGLAAYLFQVKN